MWRGPRDALAAASIACEWTWSSPWTRDDTGRSCRRRRRAPPSPARNARRAAPRRSAASWRSVRRRLMLRTALTTAGYGVGILGAVVLLLALTAATMGPAAFWPIRHGGRARRGRRGRAGGRRLAAGAGDAPRSRGGPPRGRAAAGAGERSAVGGRARRARAHLIRARRRCPRGSSARSRTTSRAASARWMRGGWCRCGPRRARSRPPSPAIARRDRRGDAVADDGARPAHAGPHAVAVRGRGDLGRRRWSATSASPTATRRTPGLPPRTVEGSTGDVAAVKGTRVRIETHPLRAARKALLLLGETGEKGEIGGVAVGQRADRRADAERGRELPVLAAAAARAAPCARRAAIT